MAWAVVAMKGTQIGRVGWSGGADERQGEGKLASNLKTRRTCAKPRLAAEKYRALGRGLNHELSM